MNQTSQPSIKQNYQTSLRLFCFPYAGGSSQIFRSWSNHLPTNIEVCPVELPGRGSRFREAAFTKLIPLVEAITQNIRPHLDDKPFAFFGHSMGALVSFEVARYLRRNYKLSPVHLFVSGRRAPQLPDLNPPIHALPEPEFLQKLRHYNGTPEAVLQNAELLQLVLPIVRADFEAIETYIYVKEPPLDCPIATLGGLQDGSVSCYELEEWRNQTNNDFSLKMLPGAHFFIQSSQLLTLSLIGSLLNK